MRRSCSAARSPTGLRSRRADGERALADYVAGFAGGKPLEVLLGPPDIEGRFFYREDMRGFNFTRQQVPLGALMGQLLHLAEAKGRRSTGDLRQRRRRA